MVEKRVKVVSLRDVTPELHTEWSDTKSVPLRPGGRGNTKLFSSDLAAECEVSYQRYGPGYLGPYHVHHHAENLWFVLEGEMEAIVGGLRYFIKAGDAIFMPADVPHTTGNRGPGEMLAVEVYAPPPSRWNPRDAALVDLPSDVRDATPGDDSEG